MLESEYRFRYNRLIESLDAFTLETLDCEQLREVRKLMQQQYLKLDDITFFDSERVSEPPINCSEQLQVIKRHAALNAITTYCHLDLHGLDPDVTVVIGRQGDLMTVWVQSSTVTRVYDESSPWSEELNVFIVHYLLKR